MEHFFKNAIEPWNQMSFFAKKFIHVLQNFSRSLSAIILLCVSRATAKNTKYIFGNQQVRELREKLSCCAMLWENIKQSRIKLTENFVILCNTWCDDAMTWLDEQECLIKWRTIMGYLVNYEHERLLNSMLHVACFSVVENIVELSSLAVFAYRLFS